MKVCVQLTVFIFLHSILRISRANILNDLAEKYGGKLLDVKFMKKKINTFMECAVECMKRQMCVFVGHKKPQKCGITDYSPRALGPKRSCKETRNYAILYPRALAGACSDHNCSKDQTCQPQTTGYMCSDDLGFKK